MIKDSSVIFDRRGEWRFKLPLSATVEGKLSEGKKFHEKINLENISSKGTYFPLESNITLGSKLTLFVELPAKLTKHKKTKLHISGTVVRLERLEKNKGKFGIALDFDKDFQFISDKKEK